MEHSELARRIISVFEPGGKLSQSIKGFEPRMQQRDMVESIINAWETNRDLVVEAGTAEYASSQEDDCKYWYQESAGSADRT